MSDKPDRGGPADEHETARRLAEQALKAQAVGDEEEAERLFAEAENTDQVATTKVLQEQADANDPATGVAPEPQR